MMNSTVCWVVGGIILLAVVPTRSDNVCSPESRSTDLGSCLDMLKVGLTDNARFWFGSQYGSLCPGGPDSSAFCGNDGYPAQDSIGTRIFPSHLDLTLIKKYVEVHYDSEEGSFSACGDTFGRKAWQGEIIPTASDVYQPWFLRHQPLITWDAADDELYTMVFYDVGHFVTHMVVVNIPGNNMSAGEVKHAYVGPDIAYDQKNPYGFFLFRQAAMVDVSAEWSARMAGTADTPFSIRDFATAHDMTGPVGVNWVVATGDEYAAQITEDKEELYTCPIFVPKAMKRARLSYIPDTAQFSVGVNMTFVFVGGLEFTVCCTYKSLGSTVFAPSPFRWAWYASYVVSPTPIITLRQAGSYMSSTNFSDQLFTLIVLDTTQVDGRGTTVPDLRYMVTNIADGNVTTGEVLQSYRGALNEDESNHAYQFMLYRQGSTLNATHALSYLQTPCPQDDPFTRCGYDITNFVEDNDLTLDGANWMETSYDAYARYVKLSQLGPSAENATTCSGMPYYPCHASSPPTALSTTPPISSCRPVCKTDAPQIVLAFVSVFLALVNK